MGSIKRPAVLGNDIWKAVLSRLLFSTFSSKATFRTAYGASLPLRKSIIFFQESEFS